MADELTAALTENLAEIGRRLGQGESFDIVVRRLKVADRPAALVYIDGFANNEILVHVLKEILAFRPAADESVIEGLCQRAIGTGEVSTTTSLEGVVRQVLSGPSVLLVDGEREAVVIDSRAYPARSVEAPKLEDSLRGPQDGFVEVLLTNVTLVRRYLRDPGLRLKALRIGVRTQTDVVIAYLADVTDPSLVRTVEERLRQGETAGIPMAAKNVEEILTRRPWYSPFPVVRFTQRPDVAVQHILDGHVAVLVDGSPNAILLPINFFSLLQTAEDSYEPVTSATLLRWMRYIAVGTAFALLPTWLLLIQLQPLLPKWLMWVVPTEKASLPIFWQILLAEIGLDLLRMALIHTPDPLSTSMGFIGAVLLGDVAVNAKLFTPAVVFWVSAVAVAVFAMPTLELGLGLRVLRIASLLLTGAFGAVGYAVAMVGSFLLIASTRSFDRPYLYPLVPFDLKQLAHNFVRLPFPAVRHRPAFVRPRDPDTRPDEPIGGRRRKP
jgi:stage V sporulation protein AF